MPARIFGAAFVENIIYVCVFLFLFLFIYFFFIRLGQSPSNLSSFWAWPRSVLTYFWLFQTNTHNRRDRVRHVCPHSNRISRLRFAAVLLPAFSSQRFFCYFFYGFFRALSTSVCILRGSVTLELITNTTNSKLILRIN